MSRKIGKKVGWNLLFKIAEGVEGSKIYFILL
jgi:hypothetical protein